jgi:hypothetical protein
MSVPSSEVGYTSVTTGRGEHEAHKGHVVVLAKKTLWETIAARLFRFFLN